MGDVLSPEAASHIVAAQDTRTNTALIAAAMIAAMIVTMNATAIDAAIAVEPSDTIAVITSVRTGVMPAQEETATSRSITAATSAIARSIARVNTLGKSVASTRATRNRPLVATRAIIKIMMTMTAQQPATQAAAAYRVPAAAAAAAMASAVMPRTSISDITAVKWMTMDIAYPKRKRPKYLVPKHPPSLAKG